MNDIDRQRKRDGRNRASRRTRALQQSEQALQLAIDARELGAGEFLTKYERHLKPRWITPTLERALRAVRKARA